MLQEIEEIRDSVLGGFDHLQEQNCLKRKEAERLRSFIRSLNGAELMAVVSSCGGVGMSILEAQGVAGATIDTSIDLEIVVGMSILEAQGVVVRVPVPASWD